MTFAADGGLTTTSPVTESVGFDLNPSNGSRSVPISSAARTGGSVSVLDGACWAIGVVTLVCNKNTDLSWLLVGTVTVEVVPRVEDITHGTAGVDTVGDPGIEITVVNTFGLDATKS